MYSIDQVLKSEKLPSLPQVALQIIELAKLPEPDFGKAAHIIQSDPALTAQIIRAANSVLFGLRGKTSTVREALNKLGITMVRSIALSFYLAPSRSNNAEWDQTLQVYWWRSLSQACAAEELGLRTDSSNSSKFFLGGLLQDIGILALLNTHFDIYKSTYSLKNTVERIAFENGQFGFNHLDVSQRLFQNWTLEKNLVDAMQQHTTPIPVESMGENSRLRIALRTASLVAEKLFQPNWESVADAKIIGEYQAAMFGYYGFLPGEEEKLVMNLEKRVQEIATGLKINIGAFPSNEEILRNANQLLSDIAMAALIQNTDSDEARLRDPLTGLYNRRKLDEISLSDKGPLQSICVLFIDVDDFKNVNDGFGHKTGDEALQMVAEILKQIIEDDQFVFRYGGDEFVVLLRNVKRDQAKNLAQDVASKLDQTCSKRNWGIRITLSIGTAFETVSTEAIDEEGTISQLIGKADDAMYEAKRKGGNQAYFTEPMVS